VPACSKWVAKRLSECGDTRLWIAVLGTAAFKARCRGICAKSLEVDPAQPQHLLAETDEGYRLMVDLAALGATGQFGVKNCGRQPSGEDDRRCATAIYLRARHRAGTLAKGMPPAPAASAARIRATFDGPCGGACRAACVAWLT
jgi:hypothetical protein